MRAQWFLAIGLGFLVAEGVVPAATIHVPEERPTIQDGIDAAGDGDTVLVAPGTYPENINFNGKGIVVRSTSGWVRTVIDGAGGTVVRFESGEDSTSILEGFTLYNGNSGFDPGGILLKNRSSPVIRDSDINHNSSAVKGGGIGCMDHSSPTLMHCIIRNNVAGSHFGVGGGGIACYGHSHLTLLNCSVEGNDAPGMWGGIAGAILCDSSSIDLVNCAVIHNTGFFHGGIICQGNSEVTISNCTIAANTNGGLILDDESSGILKDSIVWANTGGGVGVGSSATLHIRYCDTQDNWTGIGNISSDPLFVDLENGNVHLKCGSPCIDAGDPESPLDPDGTRTDMGAFYFDKRDYAVKGDVNFDCTIDVLDVLDVVCILLVTCEYDDGMFLRADWNGDDEVNILDVVGLVRYIIEGPPDSLYVAFEDVEDYGTFCVRERGTAIITSDWEWTHLWKLYWNCFDGHGNRTPPPEIDFSEEMVLGVFWGGDCAYSGCTNQSPSIESVWIAEDTLRVKVGELRDLGPCDGCVCPLHLIQIQRYDLPVRFTGSVP